MAIGLNPLPLKSLCSIKKTLSRKVEQDLQKRRDAVILSYVERQKKSYKNKQESEDGLVEGDIIIALLRKYIRYKKTLSKQQLLFTELYIRSLIPFIYGDDFSANELRIMMENYMDRLFQLALICCPRRFGKTYITSWFITCVIAAVPKIRATVFSPSSRQSMAVMTHVKTFFQELVKLAGFKYQVVKGKDNQECFAVIIDGTERIVKALPAQENTVRGVDADFAVLDEAAATPKQFMTKIIMPVAIPGKTALVAMSTIQGASDSGQDNWFTTMMNLRADDGGPLYSTYKFLLACDACIEANTEETCTHKMGDLPHWHAKSKHALFAIIYKGLGEEESMLQENKGIIKGDGRAAFLNKSIMTMFNVNKNPLVEIDEIKEPPPFVFTYIDPAAGGRGSDMAIVSLFKLKGEFVFCGIDSIAVELTKVYIQNILKHLHQIRTLPHLQHCVIVLAVEGNMGLNSSDITDAVLGPNGVKNVVVLSKHYFEENIGSLNLFQAKRKRESEVPANGIVTRGEIKVEAYKYFKDLMDTGQLRFYSKCFASHNPKQNITDLQNITNIKTMLKQQIINLTVLFKVRSENDPAFEETVYTLSSKHKGKDDLVTASQLAVRLVNKFMLSESYKRGLEHLQSIY